MTRVFASTTGSSGRNSSVLVLRSSVGRSEANPAVMSMMMVMTTTGWCSISSPSCLNIYGVLRQDRIHFVVLGVRGWCT